MRGATFGRETRAVHGVSVFFLIQVLVAGVVAGAATAVAPAGVVAATPASPAVISQELKSQLAASPTGKVRAVITAWRHRDLGAIKALGVRGASLRHLPMILARGVTVEQLAKLQRSPLVRSVWHNEKYALRMEDSTWITQARYAWGPPLGHSHASWTGDGVDIAVIDTGIDGAHEDADNLVEFCDTTAAATGDRSEVACSPHSAGNIPLGVGDPRVDAFDDEGHGSHVSGTIAGTGDASGGMTDPHSTIGMAPEANLHVYSSNVGLFLVLFQILASYDDMTFKKVNGMTDVVATSNSFGGGTGATYDPNDPESVAIKAAFDAGILAVYAAGNSGPEHNTLSDACISPWAICVGATTKADSVVMFSSRGRPSEPADTDRNGTVGDAGDMAPDNHDRKLAQRLDLGIYRPTLVAPGVSINSISAFLGPANEVGPCAESLPDGTHTNCYEPLQGTSMATPHVSGAIALIVEAYRNGHGGTTPSPNRIIQILERSAAKLPGWEAEEQGAGRLDALAATRLAKRWPADKLPRPSLGTPSPVYAAGLFPGAAGTKSEIAGCTPVASFTTGNPTVHEITVPKQAERLRVTIDAENDDTNNYLMLWRPGVDPSADSEPKGRSRSFADQESTGLLNDDNLPINPDRFVDVRAPEHGVWTLEVFNRQPADEIDCVEYTGVVEIPISARVPTVAITSPPAGSTHTNRFIPIRGTATYPQRWDGVSIYEVPGTQGAPGEGITPNEFLTLHFQGNLDEDCSGLGQNDLDVCGGPFLLESGDLDSGPAATFLVPEPFLDCTVPRCEVDPNFLWDLEETTTLGGPMTVEWWATSTSVLGQIWRIALWVDGREAFETQVFGLEADPTTPTKLSTEVQLPLLRAEQQIVLHVDPYSIDQVDTTIYYDSDLPCGAGTTPPCDSTVTMPIVTSAGASAVPAGGGGATVAAPMDLRVTDRHGSLRIAWDPADGATKYRIHRSTNPSFVPGSANRIATTTGTGCTSPNVPSWPTASDGGALCYADTGVAERVTYYYRVVGVGGGTAGEPSGLAYGARSRYDRQVRVKADQVYGLGYWGPAGGNTPMTSWRYVWDTLGREDSAGAGDTQEWRVFARSFTQGIGSAKVGRRFDTEGEAPIEPRDPVVTLVKTGPAEAQVTDTIRYTLQYENLGPETSSGAVVTDALPAELKFVSASDGGTFDSATRTVTWRVGDVPAGTSDTLVLRAKVRASNDVGTVIVNRADFTAPLTLSPPTAVAETTVVP